MLTFLAFTFTLPKKCQVLFAIKIFSNYETNTYLPKKKGYKYTHFASFVIDKKSFSLAFWIQSWDFKKQTKIFDISSWHLSFDSSSYTIWKSERIYLLKIYKLKLVQTSSNEMDTVIQKWITHQNLKTRIWWLPNEGTSISINWLPLLTPISNPPDPSQWIL